ncbi:Rho GTPase activation protein [Globomyces pollinis-pini]|nr:Rho GTPase activation protein [Globomyces pollinis-pini]
MMLNNEANSDSEDSESNPWHIVTTEDGQVYYWNEETNETTWDPPASLSAYNSINDLSEKPSNATTEEKIVAKSPFSLPTDSQAKMDHIEIVPAELIRKEGPISYKMKKEFGGLEPKKSHSWHSTWAIICVGYMVFYKDDPVKLKKKSSDKPILPVYVLKLETVNIKKEPKDGSRKNLISVQSRSGAILLLQPAAENELNEWYSCINDSTKENSTSAEHENVMQKLFTKGPQPVGSSKEDKKTKGLRKATLGGEDKSKDDDDSSKSKVKSKIHSFFKRVGDVRNDLNNMNIGMNINKKEKEVEIHPDELIFGGSLEKLAKSTNRNIPIVVERCISHVETHGGLESQGIYRLSGTASIVQKYRTQINQNNDQDIYEPSTDVNVIAALLKLFFREVQEPVIPFSMYDRYIDCMKIEDYNNRLIELKNLVQQLPKVHYDVLEYLLTHLVKVCSLSSVNKMEPQNIAIVFGPSLIRKEENPNMQAALGNLMNMSFQNGLVEALLTQKEWLFDGSPN